MANLAGPGVPSSSAPCSQTMYWLTFVEIHSCCYSMARRSVLAQRLLQGARLPRVASHPPLVWASEREMKIGFKLNTSPSLRRAAGRAPGTISLARRTLEGLDLRPRRSTQIGNNVFSGRYRCLSWAQRAPCPINTKHPWEPNNWMVAVVTVSRIPT